MAPGGGRKPGLISSRSRPVRGAAGTPDFTEDLDYIDLAHRTAPFAVENRGRQPGMPANWQPGQVVCLGPPDDPATCNLLQQPDDLAFMPTSHRLEQRLRAKILDIVACHYGTMAVERGSGLDLSGLGRQLAASTRRPAAAASEQCKPDELPGGAPGASGPLDTAARGNGAARPFCPAGFAPRHPFCATAGRKPGRPAGKLLDASLESLPAMDGTISFCPVCTVAGHPRRTPATRGRFTWWCMKNRWNRACRRAPYAFSVRLPCRPWFRTTFTRTDLAGGISTLLLLSTNGRGGMLPGPRIDWGQLDQQATTPCWRPT